MCLEYLMQLFRYRLRIKFRVGQNIVTLKSLIFMLNIIVSYCSFVYNNSLLNNVVENRNEFKK